MTMRIALILLSIVAMLCLFFWSLRATIFDVSLAQNRCGGVLIVRELFLLVLLGSLLVETLGHEKFITFYITHDSVRHTTPIIFLCVASLILFIGFFSKTVFKNELTIAYSRNIQPTKPSRARNLLNFSALLLLLLVLVGHAAGMTHAFSQSLLTGIDLMQVRLANRSETAGPPQVLAYIRYFFQFIAVLVGLYGRYIGKTRRLFILLLVVYAATLPGDKAPLIQVILLYFLGRIGAARYSSGRLVMAGAALIAISILTVYVTTSIQYPDITADEFLVFVLGRLGFGQIQGVYEEFSLRLRDTAYILSEIPMSGIFGNPKAFSKDLMGLTYGYYMDYSEFGVMNSLFIAEAYAIGGLALALTSPILVAFNFCLIAFGVCRALRVAFKLSSSDAQVITAAFISAVVPFTGDLGGLLFGKKLLVIMFMFAVLFIFVRLCSALQRTLSGGTKKMTSHQISYTK